MFERIKNWFTLEPEYKILRYDDYYFVLFRQNKLETWEGITADATVTYGTKAEIYKNCRTTSIMVAQQRIDRHKKYKQFNYEA